MPITKVISLREVLITSGSVVEAAMLSDLISNATNHDMLTTKQRATVSAILAIKDQVWPGWGTELSSTEKSSLLRAAERGLETALSLEMRLDEIHAGLLQNKDELQDLIDSEAKRSMSYYNSIVKGYQHAE